MFEKRLIGRSLKFPLDVGMVPMTRHESRKHFALSWTIGGQT
jgi:hypothetical protein